MVDLKLESPATEPVEIDDETREAIRRGIADVEAGRTVSLDQVAEKLREWNFKFASQKPR